MSVSKSGEYGILMVLSLATGVSHGVDEVVPYRIDIGKQTMGERVTAKGWLSNSTAAPMKIKSIKTNCACAKAVPSAWTIEPGERISVDVELDGTDREGPFLGSVAILQDCEPYLIGRMQIVGEFLASDHHLRTNPIAIERGSLGIRKSASQIVRVTRTGGIDVGQVRATTSHDWLTVRELKDRSRINSLCYLVEAKAPERSGRLEGQVIFASNGDKDAVRVPVYVMVAPRVRARPATILVSSSKTRYVVRLEDEESAVGSVEAVTWMGSGMELLGWGPLEDGNYYLDIRLDGNGFAEGTLVIQLSGPSDSFRIKCLAWSPMQARQLQEATTDSASIGR